jgi:ABC-type Mn2+/Zn2+ transport system ATPase subunit
MNHLRLVVDPASVDAQPAAILMEHAQVRYTPSGPAALDDVSLRVARGSFVALVGANGAGKSTLLKAVAGAIDVQAGEVRIFGEPVRRVRRRLAYLPQVSEIDWRFPILAHTFVMTGRYPHLGWLRRAGAADRELVHACLDRLGLTQLRERQIGELSGGQRQRLLLARALAQQADLLLLDEPLNAVDATTQAVLLQVLAEQKAHGTTVVIATHEVEVLTSLVDETAVLADGKLLEAACARSANRVLGGAAWTG